MITLIDIVHNYILISKPISNVKTQQVLSSLSLNDIGVFLGDGPHETDGGIVSLHQSKGKHLVA